MEHDETVRRAPKHILAVGYDNDSALKGLKGVSHRHHGLHIQVVRGFVQEENITWRRQNLAKQNSTSLSSREHRDLFQRVITFKHHAPTDRPDRRAAQQLVDLLNLILNGVREVQAIGVRLREEGELRVRAYRDLPRKGLKLIRE